MKEENAAALLLVAAGVIGLLISVMRARWTRAGGLVGLIHWSKGDPRRPPTSTFSRWHPWLLGAASVGAILFGLFKLITSLM